MHRRLTLVALACLCTTSFAFHRYAILDLGDVAGGADSSFAQDINDNGVVTGVGSGPNGQVPFRWVSGQGIIPLPLLGGKTQAYAGAIDSRGNISGAGFTSDAIVDGHPVMWNAQNQLIDIGLPQGMTWAISNGMNDQGVMVGWGDAGSGRRGFTWSAATGYTIFQPLAGDSECGLSDVSNDGTIAGWSGLFATSWKNGSGSRLFNPQGGVDSFPNLITDDNRICGYVHLPGGNYIAGVWTTDGRFTQEDQLSGYPSMDCVWVSHDGGTILGASYDNDFERATLFNPIDGLVELSSLADASTLGWTLKLGITSNRWGQIVGSGLIGGHEHAFIATPVVTPDKITVNLGRLTEGGLQGLEDVDNNGLTVCSFLVPNQQVAPVTVELEAQCPVSSPSSYFLRLVSKVANSGQFEQTVDLYNWETASYDDARTDALGTAFKTVELHGTGSNLFRYVGLGRTLRARYRIRATGLVSSAIWCTVVDAAQFVTMP